MKKTFICRFLIAFLCLSFTPIHAKDTQNILISGEGLPYIMVASIQSNDSLDMYLIPNDLSLPQLHDQQKTKSLALYDKQKEIRDMQALIQEFFHLPSNHTLYLHMDAIQEDMGVAYDDKTFSDLKHMSSYFAKVAKQLKLSMLFRASHYLEDDLNISDYYSLYKLFHDGTPTIRYHYVNYLYVDEDTCYPLNNQFT